MIHSHQVQLLLEALAMAASRHESMARVQKFGRPRLDGVEHEEFPSLPADV